MIFTVSVVIVDSEAFVDPRLDTATHIIRDSLGSAARDLGSYELISTCVVPQNVEEIRNTVRTLVEGNSVDWILVVGGIGFEARDCTPEVCRMLKKERSELKFYTSWVQLGS